jgi:DNA polymerase-1
MSKKRARKGKERKETKPNHIFFVLCRVEQFSQVERRKALSNLYVRTKMGRYRFFAKPIDARTTAAIEREAFSTIIQGSAADLMKRGMLLVWNGLRERQLTAKILLQIHDELLLEVPLAEVEPVKELLQRAMSAADSLYTALPIKIRVGPNWANME